MDKIPIKRFLIFLLCITTCVIGCKKEEKDNVSKYALNITSDVEGIEEILLIGYLADGTKSVIGKGGPSPDGYTVYIDAPLSPIYLYNIKGVPDYPQHFQFSNPDVLCYDAVYFFQAFKNSKHIGTFKHVNHVMFEDEEEVKEACWVKYIYVTGDVSITGTHVAEGRPYQTYDLHLKKGWNAYAQIDYRHAKGEAYNYSLFTSDIPAGTKWEL